MHKRICSLLLLPLLLLTLCTPAQALTGGEMMTRMDAILYFIQTNALEYDLDAITPDQSREELQALFEADPAAFDEMMNDILQTVDSHSMYIPTATYDQVFAESTAYVGVGITMERTGDHIAIKAIEPAGPAAGSGLQVGDILTHVDGQPLPSRNLNEIAPLIRGEAGTQVTLTVRRGTRSIEVTLTRASIVLPNISGEVLEEGIYYMDINRFDGDNTYSDFAACYAELLLAETRALIIDLRGNPGGELSMVMTFLNRLIPDEDLTYFTVEGRPTETSANRKIYRSSGIGPRLNQIILLTDNGSASASEMLTASLRDLGYAVSVGQTTHGKARGQRHLVFYDGAAAVVTTVRLTPPSGEDYEGTGLRPDYPVENYIDNHPAASADRLHSRLLVQGDAGQQVWQLQEALRALGYLTAAEDAFGPVTLEAVNHFRRDLGLTDKAYLDAYTANRINEALDSLSDLRVTVDAQLDMAVELARKAAAEPIQYTLDLENNTFENLN